MVSRWHQARALESITRDTFRGLQFKCNCNIRRAVQVPGDTGALRKKASTWASLRGPHPTWASSSWPAPCSGTAVSTDYCFEIVSYRNLLSLLRASPWGLEHGEARRQCHHPRGERTSQRRAKFAPLRLVLQVQKCGEEFQAASVMAAAGRCLVPSSPPGPPQH